MDPVERYARAIVRRRRLVFVVVLVATAGIGAGAATADWELGVADFEVGTYVPTLVEWVIALGSIAVAILLFAVATRIVPMSGRPNETGSTADVTTEVSD